MTEKEKEALERRIDELCAEVERLRKAKDTMHGDAFEIGAMLVKARDENAKLREFANEMFKEILLLPEYQMGSKRKRHFIDKGIELGLRGWA